MTDLRHATRLTILAVSAALLFAACSGAAATPTPVAVGAATPTPEAVVTPTPDAGQGGVATPEPTPDLAIPTFDLKALTGAIPGVDSYRTSTSVGGVKQYESIVVTQPVLSKAITVFDGDAVSARYIVIGDKAWTADGAAGKFQSIPASQASTFLMVFDPALMLGAYASVDWAHVAADQGSEEKNGVQAHHLRIDSTSILGAAGAMPAGSAIDVWVADAGYLIAWEMSGFPGDANFSIQITNVNDAANKVEAPS